MKIGNKAGILLLAIVLLLSACGMPNKTPLDPENPITIVVWNYYNGSVKDKFDALVLEFNETIGADQGIVVEAQSYGAVNELADAVLASAAEDIGSQPMPDIFAAYPDNVQRVNRICELVTLTDYFTQDELGAIKKEFLYEGTFGSKQELKILPIAKSTEVLYLNKTYWNSFAQETGATLDALATWEGLVQTARLYYEHTGKAFFSVDSNANFMLVTSMQLAEEFYTYDGETASINYSEDTAYRVWKHFYVPYINGYFAKSGRFSSDDAKAGLIIAYTGSTAGAAYFPVEAASPSNPEKMIPVEVATLPYPYFEGGKPFAVQQGAGMCISKSDAAHEYASAVFLKWFISLPQNIEFAVSTAYLPVRSEALSTDKILEEMERENITNLAVKSAINTTMDMLKTHILYGNKPFNSSFEIRNILEANLFNRVKSDLASLEGRVKAGEDRMQVIEELCSKEAFLDWYEGFAGEIQSILDTSAQESQ